MKLLSADAVCYNANDLQLKMRADLILLRFCAVLAAAMFAMPSVFAESFDGQSYVPLAEFAHANGLSATTLKHGDELILSNKNHRLVFNINATQAEIDGVNVRLSFPIAGDHGQLFISQLDINTALRPLIYPQKFPGRKITTICLDPGHGGKDSGNHVGSGFFSHSEKTYTLALAFELRTQLEKAGFHVIMTRRSDVYVELPERPEIANHAGADLFISLHFNASPVDQGDIEGPETYCITPVGAPSSNAHGEPEGGSMIGTAATVANRNENKSLRFAYEMEKSLVKNLDANDRGVRRARFAVLRDATMPAILIEGGYMTNPVEGRKIYDAEYRRELAAAIVKGILAYEKFTLSGSHSAVQTSRTRLQ